MSLIKSASFTVLTIAAALSMNSAFAKTKVASCSLYANDPVITHDQYGTNTGHNTVNSGVLRILQNNGFTISTNPDAAEYTMNTEVRCGQMWTMFGMVDGCQTEVTIIDNKQEKLVYSNGPTVAMPGLNINYDAIIFPLCKNL